MKGYASVADVEAYMGADFDTQQAMLCEIMLGAAESWIDEETHHAWMETGTKTAKIVNPQGPFLNVPGPVASVTSLVVNAFGVIDGAPAPITLLSYQYSLLVAEHGRIYSPFTPRVYEVVVTYVPDSAAAVPGEIKLATIALAANGMRLMPSMNDGVDPTVLQQYMVGAELQVTFRDTLNAGANNVPEIVTLYLSKWAKGYAVV